MEEVDRVFKRYILAGVAAVFAVLAIIAASRWKSVINNGGQVPQEPFRIAGNLYYVGTRNVTSFLLTGSQGHILIDGGFPGTAPMIMQSIGKLGFNMSDVKILLNSHAHFDHAGGLAALQKVSGARLWVSEADAGIITSGGANDPTIGALKFLVYVGLIKYPVPRVDHRFNDGARIRLGPINLTAHITAGHTRGCTSWSFPICAGGRELLAVIVGELAPPVGVSLGETEAYPGNLADYENSFDKLRSLPADVFLASDAGYFGMSEKLQARATSEEPVQPFIDRDGYLKHIDRAEERFRKLSREQHQDYYGLDLHLH